MGHRALNLAVPVTMKTVKPVERVAEVLTVYTDRRRVRCRRQAVCRDAHFSGTSSIIREAPPDYHDDQLAALIGVTGQTILHTYFLIGQAKELTKNKSFVGG